MVNKIISWLENKDYLFAEYSPEESSKSVHIFYAVDPKGMFIEFKYDTRDHYLCDRVRGSKYWDIFEKINFGGKN